MPPATKPGLPGYKNTGYDKERYKRLEQKEWFTEQVKKCEDSIYRLSMSILRNADDAADAAQEAIFIAYRKLYTLRDKSKFRSWLLRILANECYGMLRQRQRYVDIDSLAEVEAPAPPENQQPLWQAVCDLNEDMRSVVVLFYYEGFSIQEIATILKISEANTKTRLYRARLRLRMMLGEEIK